MRNTFGNSNRAKSLASAEGSRSDVVHAIGNNDITKRAALVEYAVLYSGKPLGNIKRFYLFAVVERLRADGGNALGNIDIFQLGAYYDTVAEVSSAIYRAKSLTMGACEVFGTISAASTALDIEKACYTCIKESDGLMVFELSHIINNKSWAKIKAGVEKAEKELGIRK